VLDVADGGFIVHEIVAGLDLAGLQAMTEAPLRAAPDLAVLAAPLV
jgi:acyl CoA:acetate/3-ketoacid CoA transferase beta subunit